MNLLTPEKVKQGVAEVVEGKTFCLSLPLDYPGGRNLNPRRFPPRQFATQRGGLANFNFPLSIEDPRHTDVVCDDAVLLCLQYSTQWDSLCHIGSRFDADGDGEAEICYYNGWRAGDHVVAPTENAAGDEFTQFEGPEARKLGIQNMAETCVQGRAVMIDLHKHFGRDRKLVDFDDLQMIMDKDNVNVETGDMVCLHTGFAGAILEMNKNPDPDALHSICPVINSRDDRILNWITECGLAALIADNYAIEQVPSADPANTFDPFAFMPLHEHCIFKLGIHLGELWHLSELAGWLEKAGRSRFLLTAPPLRLPGAVGSPSTPVATV